MPLNQVQILKSLDQLQTLITQLSQSPTKDYNAILNDFDFSSIDFKSYENWSQKRYTRNCLYRDAKFELILICWERGQQTAVHGHNGEDCWVYLIEGKMEEVYYSFGEKHFLKKIDSKEFSKNELSFMNDTLGFHKLKNSNPGKSLSLHIYSKPIENCVAYDEITQSFIDRNLSYDTLLEPLVLKTD